MMLWKTVYEYRGVAIQAMDKAERPGDMAYRVDHPALAKQEFPTVGMALMVIDVLAKSGLLLTAR